MRAVSAFTLKVGCAIGVMVNFRWIVNDGCCSGVLYSRWLLSGERVAVVGIGGIGLVGGRRAAMSCRCGIHCWVIWVVACV